MPRQVYAILPALLALAACSAAEKPADVNAERDPAAAAALNDPIMVDPDLVSQNRGNSALSGGGPAQGDLPDFVRTPEAADAARAAAQAAVGGSIITAPAPSATIRQSRLAGALTAQALAQASGLAGSGCGDQFEYSAAWAARLPAALQVYPRGHTIMAGGTSATRCHLAVVRFVTPVEVTDVVDFYYTSARAAKMGAEHRREGSDDVVAGAYGNFGYAVYARKRADGLTEVDLVARLEP